jgi:alpha-1,3-rhamnosyl/mannosyltransferase
VQSGRRWNYYLNRTLSRYALERARRLFVLSDYCVQKLEELFPQHRDKFRVTPCGVTAAVAEASERLLWPVQPQTYFLYVGVFSENKNQRRLLEAWGQLQKKYPAWPALVLIGRCDPNYQQEVIAPALRKLPRPAEVILLARVSPAELTWYYRQALAYVQPSIAEGFGLPVIEAMSHGLAVTCSDTTSLPEVAGDAALYFDPFDVGSMVQSLERLGQDENLRNDLRHRGQVRAQTFTWERHASLVAGEIESVLAEIKSRTP